MFIQHVLRNKELKIMTDTLFTLENFKTLIVNSTIWFIAICLIKDNVVINRWIVFSGMVLLEIVGIVFYPWLAANPAFHCILLMVELLYVFLIKENRLNTLNCVYVCQSLYNLLSNAIMGIAMFAFSIMKLNGEWIDIDNKNSAVFLFMAAIAVLSCILTIRFGIRIKPYMMEMEGWKQVLLFIAVPIVFICSAFLKILTADDYSNSPSGVMFAADTIMVILSGISIVLLIIGSLHRRKVINRNIRESIDVLQAEYDELRQAEEELKIIRHELKNTSFEDK